MAPASVGVARPMKIVPSTRKMRTTDGTMPHSTRLISGQPFRVRASGGSGGIAFGRNSDTAKMNAMNSSTCRIDGPIAPRYMSPTERPIWSASTTRTSDGGMSCVIVPEAAITPVARRLS